MKRGGGGGGEEGGAEEIVLVDKSLGKQEVFSRSNFSAKESK